MALLTKELFREGWVRMRAGLSGARPVKAGVRVQRAARFVGGGIADLLYPPSCVSCAAELHERVSSGMDVALCDECLESFELFSEPMCMRCGAPVPAVTSAKRDGCYRCMGRKLW